MFGKRKRNSCAKIPVNTLFFSSKILIYFPIFSASTLHAAVGAAEVPIVFFFTRIRVIERKAKKRKRDVIIGRGEDQKDT